MKENRKIVLAAAFAALSTSGAAAAGWDLNVFEAGSQNTRVVIYVGQAHSGETVVLTCHSDLMEREPGINVSTKPTMDFSIRAEDPATITIVGVTDPLPGRVLANKTSETAATAEWVDMYDFLATAGPNTELTVSVTYQGREEIVSTVTIPAESFHPTAGQFVDACTS